MDFRALPVFSGSDELPSVSVYLCTYTNELGLGDPPAGHPGPLTTVTLGYIRQTDGPESSRHQLDRREL